MRSFLEEVFGLTAILTMGVLILAAIMWLGMHDGPSPFVGNTCVVAPHGGTVCGPPAP